MPNYGYSTYSFADVHGVITIPGYGSFLLEGAGTGSITISPTTDKTQHLNSADGRIGITKVLNNAASININVQQVSPLHSFLVGAYNFLYASPTALWPSIQLNFSTSGGSGAFTNIICTGTAFVKIADQPFEEQMQMVTWPLLSANHQVLG